MLGKTVEDRITGFKGVVTGQVTYLTGCNQCLVTPRIKEDGTRREAEWFDEQRLDVVSGVPVIALDNSKSPGFDKQAPKR